jgi:hypothetical protein
MFWNALLNVLVYALETYGDDIVKSTKNPFDDVALKAILGTLKVIVK